MFDSLLPLKLTQNGQKPLNTAKISFPNYYLSLSLWFRHGSSSSKLYFSFDYYVFVSKNTINEVRNSFWADEMHI